MPAGTSTAPPHVIKPSPEVQMFSTELLTANLLSPVILAFALGLIARSLRSDLEIPAAIQSYLSIFLLLAIGLKGGVALRQDAPDDLAVYLAATVLLGVITAISAYFIAKAWLRDNRINAAAMAAHFGSVSAVTFIAAQQFSERTGQAADSVLVALVVAMEIPAILIGLALAKGSRGIRWHDVREVVTGKTALLLLGGLTIGALSSKDGLAKVDAMYFQLFQGTLMLFMLDMGMLAAGQLRLVGREAFRSPSPVELLTISEYSSSVLAVLSVFKTVISMSISLLILFLSPVVILSVSIMWHLSPVSFRYSCLKSSSLQVRIASVF